MTRGLLLHLLLLLCCHATPPNDKESLLQIRVDPIDDAAQGIVLADPPEGWILLSDACINGFNDIFSDPGCWSLSLEDCVSLCEASNRCRSLDYSSLYGQCCLSTKTRETAPGEFVSPCYVSSYDYYEKMVEFNTRSEPIEPSPSTPDDSLRLGDCLFGTEQTDSEMVSYACANDRPEIYPTLEEAQAACCDCDACQSVVRHTIDMTLLQVPDNDEVPQILGGDGIPNRPRFERGDELGEQYSLRAGPFVQKTTGVSTWTKITFYSETDSPTLRSTPPPMNQPSESQTKRPTAPPTARPSHAPNSTQTALRSGQPTPNITPPPTGRSTHSSEPTNDPRTGPPTSNPPIDSPPPSPSPDELITAPTPDEPTILTRPTPDDLTTDEPSPDDLTTDEPSPDDLTTDEPSPAISSEPSPEEPPPTPTPPSPSPTPPESPPGPSICIGQDYGCCTTSDPCGYMEGDCDSDSECEAELVCGANNCNVDSISNIPSSNGNGWDTSDDCCDYPSPSPTSSILSGVEIDDPPHIIFILVDDLGWRDTRFHGAEYETTNIDRLAATGVVMEQHYSEALCTPTRAAMLTGRQPLEIGAQRFVFRELQAQAIDYQIPMLGELLQDIGYSTHMVGKWHLGYPAWDDTPTARGFHTFFGLHLAKFEHFTHDGTINDAVKDDLICIDGKPKTYFHEHTGHTDFSLWGFDLWEGREGVGWEHYGNYSTTIFNEKALKLIKRHYYDEEAGPMFMLLAHAAVHDPWQAPYSYIDHYKCRTSGYVSEERQILCGMMQAVDDGVGELIEALQEYEMLDNTLIIFASDNGAGVTADIVSQEFADTKPAGSNAPLRNGKATQWEGGTRTIAVAWGNPIRPGTVVNNEIAVEPKYGEDGKLVLEENWDLFHCSDWFLTLLHFAGHQNTTSVMRSNSGKLISSYDLYNVLRYGSENPRDKIVYNINYPIENNKGAVRNKHYKLFRGANTYGWDGWYDASSMEEDEIICASNGVCRNSIDQDVMFRIDEDPEERYPINLHTMTKEEQENYDELVQYWYDWADESIEAILTGDEDYFAQGVPQLWDCHFHPWLSTRKYPIDLMYQCEDGEPPVPPARKCLESCRNKDCWRQWAELQ